MKKILVVFLALTLALSLAACGGSEPAPESNATPASKAAPAPGKSEAPANAEYTPEQVAAAEKFGALTDRYNALIEKIKADANLAALPEMIEMMNSVTASINEVDALFADPANLSAEVLTGIDTVISDTDTFIVEIENLLANYGGKQTVTVPVEIVNGTGADLYTLAMSPANDESWGGNLLTEPLLAGESGVTEMTFTEDTLVWDLLAGDSQDSILTFAGLDFSVAPMEGAQLILSVSESGEYTASFGGAGGGGTNLDPGQEG